MMCVRPAPRSELHQGFAAVPSAPAISPALLVALSLIAGMGAGILGTLAVLSGVC